MRTRLLVSLGAAVVCTWSCTSLLGDFTTGTATGSDGGRESSASDAPADHPMDAPGDAHAEGGSPEAAPPGDAEAGAPGDASDASPPLGTLTCSTLSPTMPFVVDNRDGQMPSSLGNLTSYAASPTDMRIIASPNSQGIVFKVYSVDTSSGMPVVTSTTLSGSSTMISTVRLTGGFGVIVATLTTSNDSALSLYVFPDAMPVGTLPTAVPLTTVSSAPNNVSATLVELAPGTYYLVTSGLDPTGGFYGLFSGVATGGVATTLNSLDSSGSNNDYMFPSVVHVGSTVYLYVTSHLGVLSFYPLPDSGTTTGATRTDVPPLGIGTAVVRVMIDGLAGSASGTTNLAYFEEVANDAGTALGALPFRASAVPNTDLPALMASQITFGKTYSDPALSPFGSFPQFHGDDIAFTGTGLDSSGNTTGWVNFLWLNATGVLRGESSGPVNGLFSGRGTFIRRVTAAPGAIGATSASWNIAFLQFDPNNGNADTLYFDTLQCQ